MIHGWPPSLCASERVISLWGTVCHHVKWGVSRFIPSILPPRGLSWQASIAPHQQATESGEALAVSSGERTRATDQDRNLLV